MKEKNSVEQLKRELVEEIEHHIKEMRKICPICRINIPINSLFCPYCGNKL